MTDKDKQEIAEIVVKAMIEQEKAEQAQCGGHSCTLGFDAATVETMRSFAEAVKTGKKAAVIAFITLSVGALCSAVVAGIKELISK